MIPSKVCFTGAEIDASILLYEHTDRYVKSPYPCSYTRLEFTSSQYSIGNLNNVDAWIRQNIFGKWGSYIAENQQTIVVFFEDASDAILFKLLEGEKQCLEEAIK
jgi:hypothetical protein